MDSERAIAHQGDDVPLPPTSSPLSPNGDPRVRPLPPTPTNFRGRITGPGGGRRPMQLPMPFSPRPAGQAASRRTSPVAGTGRYRTAREHCLQVQRHVAIARQERDGNHRQGGLQPPGIHEEMLGLIEAMQRDVVIERSDLLPQSFPCHRLYARRRAADRSPRDAWNCSGPLAASADSFPRLFRRASCWSTQNLDRSHNTLLVFRQTRADFDKTFAPLVVCEFKDHRLHARRHGRSAGFRLARFRRHESHPCPVRRSGLTS